MRLLTSIPSALFLWTLMGLPMCAQMVPSPDAPPSSNAPAPPDEETPVDTLKIDINLVSLFFTVKDKQGFLLPHLTQSDCKIAEDNQPQSFKSFAAQPDLPLTIGMLLDTSGSQRRVLELEQDAGSQFLFEIMRSKDQGFLLSFDSDVNLLEDLTSSPRQLSRALHRAEISIAGGGGASGIPGLGGGTIPVHGSPRGTLLYDAVYLAATQKLNQETGRKVILLLTDGQDQGSKTKLKEAIAEAQRSNLIVYVILIADTRSYFDQGEGYFGYSPMKKLAEETGGRLIDVGNNGKKLAAAFSQIEEELRTQYLASYIPSNAKKDGSFRHIELTCQPDGLKVMVRKGYYAASDDQTSDSPHSPQKK